ncbi:MAG: ABC transporter permease, partial [Ferruginibacter sp.]
SFLRNKMYTAINVGGIAIGVTAFWLIFLFVADELSYDRYNVNADRIVRVVQHTRWNGNDLHQAPTSAPFAGALKTAFPEIEEAVRIDMEGGGVITSPDKKIKQGDVIFADNSLLKIFSYDFLYGSSINALEKPQTIVITESLANKLFGSAEKALNQAVSFDGGDPNTVTGIIKDIPVASHLRFSAVRSAANAFDKDGWQNFHVYTYLLLKKGTDYKALENKLPAFSQQTIQKIMKVSDYKMELQPLTSIHLHSDLGYELSTNGSARTVYMLIIIGVLILMIAVINYINLATVRSSSRVKEIGVRKVVGSLKKNLAGMFITEAILVTIMAAFTAVMLVQFVLPSFNQLAGKSLSLWSFGTVQTLIALFVFSVVTGFIAGIYPAVFLANFKTIPSLKGLTGSRTSGIFFRKSLVVFQFTVSVVLIAGSIVIYRQMQYVAHSDLGFNKDQVLTFHIDKRNVRNQLSAVKNQLLQNPAIQGVAAAGNPIGNNDLGGSGYRFETKDGDFSTATTIAQELLTDADYIPTMDIKMLQGRNFSVNEQSDKYGAALINETLMKKLGWKDAVGKRLQFTIMDTVTLARTIVGVVKDFHTYSLQHTIEPLVMMMPPESATEDNLYVKLAKDKIPQGLAYLDKVYKQFDKESVSDYRFLNQNFAAQYEAEKKQGTIALIFTILAVTIACLGLFGLVAFTVAQRTKEIGVRKVLGANVLSIAQLLSKDFMWLVGIASCIAFPVAWYATNKWLQNFAYKTGLSWWIFVLAGLITFGIALITVNIKAIKAAVANPVKSLRNE